MTDPSAATPAGGSVIHDLGYRPYTGPRLGPGAIARALTLTGFRNAFGLGRSGKSKVLPFVLLALNLLPAVIVGGVLAFAGLDELPIGYARVRLDHPGAPRHLRRVAGAGALLARPAARHHLALPGAPAAVEHLRAVALDLPARRDPGLPAAPDPHPLRRRAARRARRRRADPAGRRRARARRAARALARRHRRARRVVVDPPRVRRGRHHRAARHRQRHRHGDPGHLAARRAGRGSARSPACSRRTRSTAG